MRLRLAFILCLRLGTILAYILALVAIVVATKKGRRGAVLVAHVLTLIFAAIASALFFMI